MSDDLNQQLNQLYDAIEAATSEGLVDRALEQCDKALQLLNEHGEDTEEFEAADFLVLAGHANRAAGDLEEAHRHYRMALEADPSRTDAMVAVGVSLFHLCRFDAARNQLDIATAEDPELDEGWYYMGLLAMRRGDRALAKRHLKRANDLDAERWPLPQEVTLDQIEEILNGFYKDMPEAMRDALKNVPIILEGMPSDDLLYSEDPPLDPLLLGLFEGTPLPDREVFGMDMPTRILIFGDNIALIAADREHLEEELWITLKHEIGHFFGLDEDELAERGLE